MNTGTAPFWMMGATVVGNPAATVITSSPGLIRRSAGSFGLVRAENANRFAEEPEFTRMERLTPMNFASSRSNASPFVSQSEPEIQRRSKQQLQPPRC